MIGRILSACWVTVGATMTVAALALIVVGWTQASARHNDAVPLVSDVPSSDDEVLAAPTPSLMETLLAAKALTDAGVIPPPPTLAETLIAARELEAAGALPSLAQTLLAVRALQDAHLLPVSATPEVDVRGAHRIAPGPASASNPAVGFPPEAPQEPVSLPVDPPAPGANYGWYDESFTSKILALVNERRVAAGLRSLRSEFRLILSASAYAKVLADYDWFSHTSPYGSTLVTRDESAGFPFTVQVGEVLALGSNGWQPDEIVQAWIDSPPHYEQIMNAVYTRAGAGCYFTQPDSLEVRCVMELAG